MIRTTLRRSVASSILLLATACGALDVSDPTAVEDSELSNAAGADLLRTDAVSQFYTAITRVARAGGILTDELLADPPAYYPLYGIVSPEEMLDRRESLSAQAVLGGNPYSILQQIRYATSVAIPKIRAYSPAGAADAHIGEMLAIRGFATLNLAENICPGFPLHDVVAYKAVIGDPLTADQALTRALADLDSALGYAADSARVLDFVRVARGRALLDLGRYTEAAAAVADVETEYTGEAEFSGGDYTSFNTLTVPELYGEKTLGVANAEGGAGLDFVAAGDPRLPTDSVGVANDGVTVLYAAHKYAVLSAPIIYASGIEARLIEAEVALHDADPSWKTILDQLRQDYAPSLGQVADPGSPEARLDVLYRERAFWLFGTGHRLGDLRRLIARYGRNAADLFPSGSYRLGGTPIGAATSIPFDPANETPYNAAVTGCTAR